ncbi:YdcF family protein [Cysteiniphilum halobium]|uniref:YdcF family protein n=1 Tax=Cysteiniphilum halobium TaxID=2219059 RepID=UPI0013C2ABEF|nr:YdcF family protein [Cysteiniphilum halobium]
MTPFCILYFSSTGIVSGYFLSGLEKYKPVTESTIMSNNALILLGAGLEKQGSVVQPTILAYSRILEAYRIYHIAHEKGVQYKIIITGGDVRKYGVSEAQVYAKILEDMGVKKDDLILESKSLNTYQNAEYTKDITKKLPYSNYLLVTSSLHMNRSLFYFDQFNIKTIPAISDTSKTKASWTPSPYNLTLISFALHEYLGIFRLHLYDYLNLNKKQNNSIIFAKPGQ